MSKKFIVFTEANIIEWRYASVKALAFADCQGEFWTLNKCLIHSEFTSDSLTQWNGYIIKSS